MPLIAVTLERLPALNSRHVEVCREFTRTAQTLGREIYLCGMIGEKRERLGSHGLPAGLGPQRMFANLNALPGNFADMPRPTTAENSCVRSNGRQIQASPSEGGIDRMRRAQSTKQPTSILQAMENRTARLTILIDSDKKKLFEEICTAQDLTPSQVVRRLIREYLIEHAGNPRQKWLAPGSPQTEAQRRRRTA